MQITAYLGKPRWIYFLWYDVVINLVRVCVNSVPVSGQRCADQWQYFPATESSRCSHLNVRLRPSDSAPGERSSGSPRWPHNGHHSTPLPRLHQPLCNALRHCYLCHGGYVIVVVCLSVCMSVCLFATYRKNSRTDLLEIFREGWQGANEQMIKFWWRSGSWIWIRITTLVRRACPSASS